MSKIKFIFCFLIFSSGIKSQNATFEKFYSSNIPLCHFIVEDTLWIGSSNCLMKISISQNKILQIYSDENSVINNDVTAIFVNSNNQLGVILNRKVIALLANNRWQTWDASEIVSKPGFQNLELNDIAISKSGIIYCFERISSRVYKYENLSWKIARDQEEPFFDFKRFIVYPDGSVWMHAGGNFTNYYAKSVDSNRIISLTSDIIYVDFAVNGTLYGIAQDGNLVNIKENGTAVIIAKINEFDLGSVTISVARNESIYINVNESLYILKDKKLTKYKNDLIKYNASVNTVKNNSLGVAFIYYPDSRMICKFDNGIFSKAKYGIISNHRIKCNLDRSIVWFNFLENICSFNVMTNEIAQFDLQSNIFVYQFAPAADSKGMWAGSSEGLLYYDGIKWNRDSLLPLHTPIYDLKLISPSQLLGLFSGGNAGSVIKQFDIPTKTWSNYTNFLPSIIYGKFYLDDNRTIWVNLGDSLAYWKEKEWAYISPRNSKMPKDKWVSMAFDSNNKLYLASKTKLFQYDGFLWSILDSNFCTTSEDLFVDSKNVLWHSVSCPGLISYSNEGIHKYYTYNSNLPNSIYQSFDEDLNGDIWVNSNPVFRIRTKPVKTNHLFLGLNKLKIFPNPSLASLNIQFSSPTGEVTIIDITGRVVQKTRIYSEEVTVDLANVSKGFYIINWSIENKIIAHASFTKN